jgi:hypothetical protein
MHAILIILASLVISGCGGGGGGSGGNPYLRKEVPYATPSLVATYTPLVNNISNSPAITDLFTADLSGNGGENLIIAGRISASDPNVTHRDSTISVMGWENNKLVDQTSKWFSAGDNIITGTEPSVKFASFNNNGKLDMFVAPSTDGIVSTPTAWIFFNNGSSFTRLNLDLSNINPTERVRADSKAFVYAHDSSIVDLNKDGFSDILIPDYGWNTTLAFNNKNGSFTTYTQQDRNFVGGSSMAAADFLNDGSVSILAVDTKATSNRPALYSWNIDGTNNLNFTKINEGPLPRFELPKWDSFNFGGGTAGNRSHDVRVVAYDWDNSNVMSAIVLSRPANTNGTWPKFSEIQFLKNNGSGVFTDVTDNILVGYNTSTAVSYNPKFMDVNGDGLVDIVLSSAVDFSGENNSSQILLKTSDGKFSAAFQNILTDFSAQTNAMKQTANMGNAVTIIKSPDNKLYLITAVTFNENNTVKQAVYLSLMGDSVVSASTAISTIQAQWPWMTDAAANSLLAKSAATYLNGKIIDLDTALKPLGGLSVNSQELRGYISGVKLSPEQSLITAQDSIGRGFTVNIAPMSNSLNSWDRNVRLDQLQLSSQSEYLVYSGVHNFNGMRIASDSLNWSIGTPMFKISDHIGVSQQITTTTFNPWVQFSGVWGQVHNASIMETVFTYRNDWFQSQLGVMNVNTNFTPGLVTKVDNITAAWTEAGIVGNHFGVFAGVKPVILNGSIEANLPTSVDNQGTIHYNKTALNLQSPITGYIRAMYTDSITNNIKLKIYGMLVDNRQYRVQTELRLNF